MALGRSVGAVSRSRAAPHARQRPAIERWLTSTAKSRRSASVDDEGRGLVGLDLPRRPAVDAVEVAVDGGRQDVELLAPVGAVAVAQQAELLEDVERPIHGRGDRPGVDRPAALDELGPRHVAIGLRQDLDERPALGRPAQAAGSQPVADVAPIGVGQGMERSGCGHRAKG